MAKKYDTLSSSVSVKFLKEEKLSDYKYETLLSSINSSFYQVPQASWTVKTMNSDSVQNFYNRLGVIEINESEIEKELDDSKGDDEERAINVIGGKKITQYIRRYGSAIIMERGCHGVRKLVCRIKVNGIIKILFYFPAIDKKQTEEEIEKVKDFIYLYTNNSRKELEAKSSYIEPLRENDKLLELTARVIKSYMNTYTSLFAFCNNMIVFGSVENGTILSYNQNEKRNIDSSSMFNCYLKGKNIIAHLENNIMKTKISDTELLFNFKVKKVVLDNTILSSLIDIKENELLPTLIFKKEATFKNETEDNGVDENIILSTRDARREKTNNSIRTKLCKRNIDAKIERDENGKIELEEYEKDKFEQTSPNENYSGSSFSAMIVIYNYLHNGPIKETLKGYVSIDRIEDKQFEKYKIIDLNDKLNDITEDNKNIYIVYSKYQKQMFPGSFLKLESFTNDNFKNLRKMLYDKYGIEKDEDRKREPNKKKYKTKFKFELIEIDDSNKYSEVENLLKKSHEDKASILFVTLYNNEFAKEMFGDFFLPNSFLEKISPAQESNKDDNKKSKKHDIGLSFSQLILMRDFIKYNLNKTQEEANNMMKDIAAHSDLYSFIKSCNKFNFFGNEKEVVTQGITIYVKSSDSKKKDNFPIILNNSFSEIMKKHSLIINRTVPFEEKTDNINSINFINVNSQKNNDLHSKIKKWDKELGTNLFSLFMNPKNGVNYLEEKKSLNAVHVQDISMFFNNAKNLVINESKTTFCNIKSRTYLSEINKKERNFDEVTKYITKINQGSAVNSFGIILDIKGDKYLIKEMECDPIILGNPNAQDVFSLLSKCQNKFSDNMEKILSLLSRKEGVKTESLEKNLFGKDIFREKEERTEKKKKKSKEENDEDIGETDNSVINEVDNEIVDEEGDDEKEAKLSKSLDIEIPRQESIVGLIDRKGIFINQNFKVLGKSTLQVIIGNGDNSMTNNGCNFKHIHIFTAKKFIDDKYEPVNMPEEAKRFILGLITKDIISVKRFSLKSLFQKFAELELGK